MKDIKPIKNTVEPKMRQISLQMRADAFMCLTLAVMGEWMLSSATKELMFDSMGRKLREFGYSEEEMKNFAEALNEAYQKFATYNDFMG